MDNIIDFGEFKLTQKYKNNHEGCQHKSMTADPNGEIVTCNDCNKQISTWYALMSLVNQYQGIHRKLQLQARSQFEVEKKQLHLKVTQNLERIWRGKLVPSCPHCNTGILLTDNLGSSCINKEIELRRRNVKQ